MNLFGLLISFSLLVMLLSKNSFAQEGRAFKLINGICIRGDQRGFNPVDGEQISECSNLENTNLSGQSFNGISAQGSKFSWANLEGSELKKAGLAFAEFRGAKMKKSQLQGARLNHADFRQAAINSGNFAESDASFADFRGIKASKVSFRGASLQSAKLSMMSCTECDFSDSDLRGADLSEGLFILSRFANAHYDKSTRLPADENWPARNGMKKD